MLTENDDVRRVAIEKLEKLAALSGWKSAAETLDDAIRIDAWLQQSEGTIQ